MLIGRKTNFDSKISENRSLTVYCITLFYSEKYLRSMAFIFVYFFYS